ncbi:MAG: cation-translocating P-type ATPase [Nitrososphaerota archaeon]
MASSPEKEITADWHALSVSECLELLGTDAEKGLSKNEARRRKEIFGPNIIERKKGVSPLKILIRQFMNLMIIILLIATAISALLGEYIDAVVILVIVLVSSVLGFWQEFRAERIVESLRKMLSPTCNVLRDGEKLRIAAEDVVPGDILLLEAGDKVVADARVIESFNLQVYEAALTGESEPVLKKTTILPRDTALSDRTNMVYAGTSVTSGKGKAVVTATGMQMEFGKIAQQVSEIREEKTPLEVRMDEVAKTLGKIVIILVATIALIDIFEFIIRGEPLGQTTIINIFMFSVSLAVAAVPEALPAIVTSTLAVGTWLLAKRNSLARNLTAVETLGSTEIICSDKTGTITKGEMTARQLYIAGKLYNIPEKSTSSNDQPLQQVVSSEELQPLLHKLAMAAVLSSDAVLRRESGKLVITGDPTEGALLVLSEKLGLNYEKTLTSHKRLGEVPFSSERKRMTTIVSGPEGYMAYMKGAPEVIISKCTKMVGDKIDEELSENMRAEILRVNEEMAARGLRVLAIAEKRLDQLPENYDESIEQGFTFIGLVGIMDPPRPEAIEAVRLCKLAGIKPVMITGDHALTAIAIAKETEIYKEGDKVLRGEDIEKKTDDELAREVEQVTVYARVSPLHKLRIVDAWKKLGKTVAMTGDGVNDAPALKKADIGIAMGITGTEVAKESSDLILLDDNFATIVKAVELGRWIYDNIKKYLAYLLQANLVEVAVIGVAALIILPLLGLHGEELLPLLPVQILYINLATDGLPAIALGFSPPDHDLMKRPPRPKREPVFTREVVDFIIRALIVETPILTLGFIHALPMGIEVARSRLFLMFIAVELTIAINCRSLIHSVFVSKPHKLLILTIIWELFLITLLINIPATRQALHMTLPNTIDLAWIMGSAIVTFFSIEVLKRIEIQRFFKGITQTA